MPTKTTIALLLLAVAIATAPVAAADPFQGPPNYSDCPLGYNPAAYANMCLYPGHAVDVILGCLLPVGNMDPDHDGVPVCIPVPRVYEPPYPGNSMAYGGVYLDVACNQGAAGVPCGCHTESPGFVVEVMVCAPLFA